MRAEVVKKRTYVEGKMKNWKLSAIILGSVLAVILMCVTGVQWSQNRAISLEEAVYTAESDIKVLLLPDSLRSVLPELLLRSHSVHRLPVHLPVLRCTPV